MKTKTNKLRFSLSTVFLGLLVLSLSLTTVTAYTFTDKSSSGTWDSDTWNDFSRSSQTVVDTGRVNYTMVETVTVSNASGGLFGFNLYLHNISGNKAYWNWIDGTMRYYFVVDAYKGNEHIYALFYLTHTEGILGDTASLKVGTRGQSVSNQRIGVTGGDGLTVSLPIVAQPVIYIANTSYLVQFQRNSNTSTTVIYSNFQDTYAPNFFVLDHMYYAENFTNSADFWTDCNIKIYQGYDGVGNFAVEWTDMAVVESPYGYNWVEEVEAQQAGFINDLVVALSGIIGTLYMLGTMLSGMLMAIVPYLGIIFFSYLADALIASVQEQSLQPIGSFYKWIFGMLMQVYERIIEIAQAVAEALPF